MSDARPIVNGSGLAPCGAGTPANFPRPSFPNPYPDLHMISWRRWGYRMIGGVAGERAALARARYMGQTLDLSAPQYHQQPGGGTTTFVGERTVYTPPPPPAPRKVIALRLGTRAPPPAPVIPAPVRVLAAAPIAQTAPPACPPCPACDKCTSPYLAAGGGALVAGLLMYFVGLSTRQKKSKRGAV